MTDGRTPSWRWGALLALGAVAALLPASAQLAFAALLIAALGLPHGASDLAVVPPERRPSFLLAYLATVAAVLACWLIAPSAAIVGLLALSIVHFALDGREEFGPLCGWCVGALLVAGPALLHRAAMVALFTGVVYDPAAALLAGVLQGIAVVALATLGAAALTGRGDRRTRARLLVGLAATIIPPPLVGFALGFVLLHAGGQTRARQAELGCATLAAYLRRVAPVLAGAGVVLAVVAAAVTGAHGSGGALLFAGIAALAVPHMLVTPLWRRSPVPARVARA